MSEVKNNDDVVYKAYNLVCDGSTYYDTGVNLFSAENIDKDFKITMKVSYFTPTEGSASQDVILGNKYEGSIGGASYPGIYFRLNSTNNYQFQIGGYNYYVVSTGSVIGKELCIWREDGTYYAQIEGDVRKTLSVREAVFDQNLTIGAGIQTDGTYFRYSTCTFDYIIVEVFSEEPLEQTWVMGQGLYVVNDVVQYMSANTKRALYVATFGDHSLPINSGGVQPSRYYPIELQTGTTSISATIASGSDVQYKLYALSYDNSTDKWMQLAQVDFSTDQSLTIPTGATHWMAAIRKGSGTENVNESDTESVQFTYNTGG